MVTTSPKTIRFDVSKEEEERRALPEPKNYTFEVPIDVIEYKVAPFNYLAINHVAMVGGMTWSGRVYDQATKIPLD